MHVSPAFLLLLQLSLILILCRAMGALTIRVGQPRVVGEMLAGIVLGPSVLGWLAPGVASFVFPPESIRLLEALAQLGVVLFLFLIGLELDPSLVRSRGRAALVISHVSIVAPFLLGAALTLVLYPRVFNDTPRMSFTSVALFMGAAMSVTAFPVLARILSERDLHRSGVGALAISCAAIDDVTAWCMLAFVVAIGRAQGLMPGVITAVLAAAYVAGMIWVVRPSLRRLEIAFERHERRTHQVLAIVLLLTLLSAAATELIGIHALFGAFLMGAIMPKGTDFQRAIVGKLEDVTTALLLPVFFAYTGLKTQIGLLDNPELWWLTGAIVAVACLGKFGGSALAARVCGIGWREASAIGILMNTRGLMELVILTIGLQIGVITEAVFAMMVIMALSTTIMTTPVLHWVLPSRALAAPRTDRSAAFRVLVPIARPDSGPGLARTLAILGASKAEPLQVHALHLTEPAANESLAMSFSGRGGAESSDPLIPFLEEAAVLGLSVEPIRRITRDRASDIARVARATGADLILMGFTKSVLGRPLLGGTVHRVMAGAEADVGVLVDRGLALPLRVLVPYQGSLHDRLAIEIARRMASFPGVQVTILHMVAPSGSAAGAKRPDLRNQTFPGEVELRLVEGRSGVDAVREHAADFDLIVAGVGEEWGVTPQMFGWRIERIAREWSGSLLLLRRQRPIAVPEPRAPGSESETSRPEALGAG